MKNHLHKSSTPINWGAVVAVVFSVCVLAIIAAAFFYASLVIVPKEDNISVRQNLDEAQLTDISQRMVRVESALHIQ